MSPEDSALLRRWTASRDAEAFDALVSRYAGLVYATALRVLRNQADAEDVAQECFLKLSQPGIGVRTSLGGWLHTVATRLSLNHLKRDTRRRAREQQYGAEQAGAADATWDDVQQHVDEAIAVLPSSQRDAIIAHFFGRQTHEAIANELGVTRRTVSYRIAKGVEQVRKNLQRRGVPIGAAALATMLMENAVEAAPAALTHALARIAVAGAGGTTLSTTVAGTAGGLVIMKSKAVVCAVLLALMLGGGYWMMKRESRASLEAQTPAQTGIEAPVVTGESLLEAPALPAEPAAPAVVASSVEQVSPPSPAPPEEAGEPTEKNGLKPPEIGDARDYASISGYVMDKDGNPIRDALVMVMASGYALDEIVVAKSESHLHEVMIHPSHVFHATSRYDGAYEVTGIRFAGFVMVQASACGYYNYSMDFFRGVVEPGAHLKGVNLFLTPGNTFRGRVVTPARDPVTDGVIFETTSGAMARTDGTGEFTMGIASGKKTLRLLVRSSAYGRASFVVGGGDSEAQPLTLPENVLPFTLDEVVELRMAGTARLEGRVGWPGGAPAVGYTVWLKGRWPDDASNDAPEYQARTGPDGRYAIDDIDTTIAFTVKLLAPGEGEMGLEEVNLGCLAPGEMREWNCKLPEAAIVRGYLSGNPSGTPLEGYWVYCLKDGDLVGETRTAADGAYELVLTQGGGAYVVCPWAFGSVIRDTNLKMLVRHGQQVELIRGEATDLDLTIEEPVTMSARFVDADGHPVTGGYAVAQSNVDGMYLGEKASVSPDGRVVFAHFPAGCESYFFHEHPNLVNVRTTPRVGAAGQVLPEETVVVYSPAGIEGTCVDENGYPFGNRHIEITAETVDGGTFTRAGVTIATGHFEMGNDFPAANVVLRGRIREEGPDPLWESEPIDLVADNVVMLGEITFVVPQE